MNKNLGERTKINKIKQLNNQLEILNNIILDLRNEFNMYEINNTLCDLENIDRYSSISKKDKFIIDCENRENMLDNAIVKFSELKTFIYDYTKKYELELLSQYTGIKEEPLLKHGIKYISELSQDLIKKDANKIIKEFEHTTNACYKILYDDSLQIYEFKDDSFVFIKSYRLEKVKKYKIVEDNEYIPF